MVILGKHKLGKRIRKARMNKGLMIKELAKILGVTEATVINWEVKGRMPQGENLGRIERFIEGKPNNEIVRQ